MAFHTAVSGTILDPNNRPFANGKINITLVPGSGSETPTINGFQFQRDYVVNCNGSGAFSISLPDTAKISPAGSKWRFNVSSSDGTANFSSDQSPSGTSSDLSTLLSADATPIGAVTEGAEVVYGKLTAAAGGTAAGEDNSAVISLTTGSSFLTGTNVTYSGGRGSATLKLSGAYSGAAGGFHNIYSRVDASGASAADGAGVVGVKSVVVNTAAVTDGNIYGGQFIAKHNHATNAMANEAPLIGAEANAYTSAAGGAGTMLGLSAVIRNEAAGGTYAGGAVHRGIQVTCDNNAGGNDPSESTGICIWNMNGTHTNGIKYVTSGSGFTYGIDMNGATLGTDVRFSNGQTLKASVSTGLTVGPLAASTANPLFYVNDSTRTAAGGGRILRVAAKQSATALTGTLEATYSRAENNVASMTGKIVGVSGYAANTVASAGGTVHGGEFWALSKGVNIGTIRGAEIGLDFDGGEAVTEATGLRVVSQAAGTITTHVGVNVVDDSASSPGGRVFDAFILCSKTATQLPGAVLKSDFSNYAGTVNGIALTAGDVPLFAYKDKDGTAHVLVLTDIDTVAIRT